MKTQNQQHVQGLPPPGQTSPGIGPVEARRSFEAVRGELEGLTPAELVTVRIDPQRAAAVVHSVAKRDAAPKRRAVFEGLAVAGLYDLGGLDKMPDAARACWYTRRQQQVRLAVASGASVPEEVVQRGYEVRSRMQRVLGHWFADDPELSAQVRFLQQGSGYQDLANDLQSAAELYRRDDVRGVIEHDVKQYRASDVDDAERVSEAIFQSFGLGDETDAARWTDLFQRAATLMLRYYDEHRLAGQYAFRKQEDVTTTYPSLVTAVRSSPSKRAPADEPSDDGGDAGEPPAGENDDAPGATS